MKNSGLLENAFWALVMTLSLVFICVDALYVLTASGDVILDLGLTASIEALLFFSLLLGSSTLLCKFDVLDLHAELYDE